MRLHGIEARRVDDLVGRPPDRGELAHCVRGPWIGTEGVPDLERVIHAAAEQVGADRALPLVDERVHLLVRSRPVERAARVVDVQVERADGRVDELSHAADSTLPTVSVVAEAHDRVGHLFGAFEPVAPRRLGTNRARW